MWPHVQGPLSDRASAAEIYALEADSQPSDPQADEPQPSLKGKKKKKTKASGLFALSALPLWGFNVYRGVIAAVLAVALLTGGVPKFILAMAGAFLCVGPFVASGFAYRFGVAFRDGPIAGLLYMFFVPYRIHYRLTHKQLFQTLRAPTLTLRDFSLLLLGACFLPVVILAAKDMDKLPRNRPPEVDWAQFAGPGKAIQPPAAVPKHLPRPPLLGMAKPPATRKNTPAKPVPADDAEVAEPNASRPAAAGPEAAQAPSPRLADADSQPAQPRSRRPDIGGRPPLFDRGARRPGPPHSSFKQAASAAFAPEETVTITVSGVADSEMRQQLNKAIIAIVKPSGGDWRVSFSTIGDKTIFRVCPIADPKAFADKIDFGKVTRVEDRSIDVEAGPPSHDPAA